MKISAKGQGVNLMKMAKQTSSVIGQKDKSQKGGFKRAKHAKYSKKGHLLPQDTHTYQVRNIQFSENLACFVFLKHLF